MAEAVAALDACGVRMVDPERVASVREAMPAEREIAELAEVFALLGEPGRLRLLSSLLEAAELCVCDTHGWSASPAAAGWPITRSMTRTYGCCSTWA